MTSSNQVKQLLGTLRLELNARGRRVGRIALGAVLFAGAAILVQRIEATDRPRAALVLAVTWAAAFAAYAIAGWLGSRRSLDHADELAVPSLVVPCVGAALLLPLTLHLPFVVGLASRRDAFDTWAAVGLIITGPTHLVFAALVGQRARQLATGAIAISARRIYGICVGVSCLPFAIFVLPPFVVAVTGLPLAAGIHLMEGLATRDRLRAAAEALPRATAVR
jgi:hypothetical protein